MENLMSASDTAIDKAADDLYTLSQDIWNKPELGNEETFAHNRITAFLQTQGFNVEPHYKGIDTAFRATYGPENATPHVAVFCEYDALPEIGHGCGHNLIAEVGVATGLGVKAAIEATIGSPGKVSVLGSPSEELDAGKTRLISSGALDGVDVAIMSHPSGFEVPRVKCLACDTFKVVYKGRASHASAFPWEGVNALDAAVLCYQNLACLRQQLKPFWQILCIISNGGTKTNIIPEKTELECDIRAPTARALAELRRKVEACIEAAAKATGCSVQLTNISPTYLNVIQNNALIETYLKHLKGIGIVTSQESTTFIGGGTDMGNVSYVVPSIHPFYSIKPGIFNHTREFTSASGDRSAQQRTLTEAKVLARVAIEVLENSELLPQVKADFQKDLEINS